MQYQNNSEKRWEDCTMSQMKKMWNITKGDDKKNNVFLLRMVSFIICVYFVFCKEKKLIYS